MTKCFCGFNHEKEVPEAVSLLTSAYHDIIQGALPNNDWLISVRILVGRYEELKRCSNCDTDWEFHDSRICLCKQPKNIL